MGVGDFGVGKTTEKGNVAPRRERERQLSTVAESCVGEFTPPRV